jgi:hypothetical protein
MRAGRVISLLVLAAGLAALPGRADEALSSDANPPNTDAAIGVTAFEQVGPAGSQLPDVASRLADQLAAKAALRVWTSRRWQSHRLGTCGSGPRRRV